MSYEFSLTAKWLAQCLRLAAADRLTLAANPTNRSKHERLHLYTLMPYRSLRTAGGSLLLFLFGLKEFQKLAANGASSIRLLLSGQQSSFRAPSLPLRCCEA